MSESSAQPTTQAPPRPPRRELHRGILTALLLIVPPVLLVVALTFALSKLPSPPADPNKPSPPPPPDETFVTKIRSTHEDAVKRLSALETSYAKLDADFQAVLGFTLADSGSQDKYSNHLLDVLTGPNPPIDAWTALRNAAVSRREFDEKRDILRAVETKIRELRVTLQDQHEVEDVVRWTDAKVTALGGQTRNLRELEARLSPMPNKETP